MAVNLTKNEKSRELSKSDFIAAIAKIHDAESTRGRKYTNIQIKNGLIIGTRESTKGVFNISIERLYQAYTDLLRFNTTTLKPYVNGVQSPALAILMAANLITICS